MQNTLSQITGLHRLSSSHDRPFTHILTRNYNMSPLHRMAILSVLFYSGFASAHPDTTTSQTQPTSESLTEAQSGFAINDTATTLRPSHLRVSVYGFAAGIDGNLGLGPHQVSPRITFSEVWNDLDSAIMAHIDYKYKKLGVYYDFQNVKTSSVEHAQIQLAPTLTLPVQADVRTKLRRSNLGAYYTAFETTGLSQKHKLKIEPTLGIHYTKAQASLYVHSDALPYEFNIQKSTSWYEPFIGSRVTYQFNPKLSVFGQADFGTQKSQGLQAYATYQTAIKSYPTHLIAGYRYINQKHEQNDFSWHIKEHGPVLGLSVQLF